ncbi:MAG TPA: helix-turn-helix domain-containing protein [Candidatus Dormibacteraeota bacterium]|nr:helix-turn-helix domain-containing protein [Candidatus Dormibacteraeota bacterium]
MTSGDGQSDGLVSWSFGLLLRHHRGSRGLTQEELAERSGLSPYAISMLERGVRRAPRAWTVEFLADALKLDARERRALSEAARAPSEVAPSGPAPAAATWTLPRDVASFTGRQEELERLLVDTAAAPGGISAIDGMAGVGKTAFTIHAAHRLAPRFPHGQFYLDLHAHTAGQRPVAPGDALKSLLLTAGVAARRIPRELDRRAAVWRDHLAGRQVLIVLDDAAGHEQVEPLLPGGAGCHVLITSRRRLAALEDARPLTLGTLPPAAATDLLTRLVGDRVREADPSTIALLVELCGHLPLAIGLVAGRLRSHPAWTASDMVRTLRDAKDGLSELQAEDVAVEAAFALSYHHLPADRQRLFRRLGLHPGLEIDVPSAAVLDGGDVAAVRAGLEALYIDHLIDEPRPGRYRFHHLIRSYARALAAQHDV